MATEFMQCLARMCALAACLSLAIPAAFASNTVIYKWKDKSGRTVYAQTPPAASRSNQLDTLVVAPLPPAQQRAAAQELARLKAEADAAQDQLRRQAAEDRIDSALRALQIAEADLRAGTIPAPSERIENFGGQPAFRASYLERMSELQAQVALARQTLDEAYALRRF